MCNYDGISAFNYCFYIYIDGVNTSDANTYGKMMVIGIVFVAAGWMVGLLDESMNFSDNIHNVLLNIKFINIHCHFGVKRMTK